MPPPPRLIATTAPIAAHRARQRSTFMFLSCPFATPTESPEIVGTTDKRLSDLRGIFFETHESHPHLRSTPTTAIGTCVLDLENSSNALHTAHLWHTAVGIIFGGFSAISPG